MRWPLRELRSRRATVGEIAHLEIVTGVVVPTTELEKVGVDEYGLNVRNGEFS